MSKFLAAILVLMSFATWAGPLVQFRTSLGNLDVELYEDKPVTVANFEQYVKTGLYQDLFFHRLVPGFIVQSGGFVVGNAHTPSAAVYSVPTFGDITNEFNVGSRYSNTFGTIAMAKTAAGPDTANSQFFFNLANNSANLDNQNGGFTVFGHLLRGTNILNRFNFPASPTNHIYIYSYADPFSQLPFLRTNQTLDDLIYVDISLLNVQVQQTNTDWQISWNSVQGKTNIVEWTLLTNRPPIWTSLLLTNGTGSNMSVLDKSAGNTKRFYRVRVDYSH
jgi:cyclophilin family peptidyl-prolyl cis-trans isomerase